MGAHAAHKLPRIVDNVRNVLGIELLCAAQGIDLRAPHRPGPALDGGARALRARVPKLGHRPRRPSRHRPQCARCSTTARSSARRGAT